MLAWNLKDLLLSHDFGNENFHLSGNEAVIMF